MKWMLVIGGGMAGLFVAVKAHDAGARVLMVSKGRVGSLGLTPFAKGIFSYDRKKASMSIDDFVAKVSESAIQTNNPVFTRQLAEHSYDRVQELKSGFFDSPIYHESFMRPINERRISVDERIMITHLPRKTAGWSVRPDSCSTKSGSFTIWRSRSSQVPARAVQTQRFSRLRPYPRRHHHGLQGRRKGNRQGVERRPSARRKTRLQLRQLAVRSKSLSTTEVTINHHPAVDLNYQAYTQGAPVVMGPPGDDQTAALQSKTRGPLCRKRSVIPRFRPSPAGEG